MKKLNLIIFLSLIQFHFSFSKTPIKNSEKLISTCKVWGFLKYYHPNVAKGDFDWAYQLKTILPKIEETKTKEDFSIILESWIDSLGEIPQNNTILENKKIKYFDKNFDLSWTKSALFSKKLRNKLNVIQQHRYQGEQFYVGQFKAGNIFAKNEDFKNFNSSDKSERLLALFTYWNLVEYFFPYKYMMDRNWNETLEKMIPEFITAESEDDFYLVMQKLTAKLNDSHTNFYRYRKVQNHYLPVFGKIIDEKLIITHILNEDLTQTYGVHIGDLITKVNNKSIKELIEIHRELIGASNESSLLDKIIEPILSGTTETITLDFENGKEKSQKVINWKDYNTNRYLSTLSIKENPNLSKFKLMENNIGYVDMNLIKVKHIAEMVNHLKKTDAIIFDLRNYPNATFNEIATFLYPSKRVFTIYTKPDLSYPGRYQWIEGTNCGHDNPDYYKGKVIVLVNEVSLSQAEWTAMCFQKAGKTTIIGSQTAGADGNNNDIDYMPAFHSSFTGLGVFYPDGRETQRIGIIPDITIKPTIKGIQEGKDEVLERALDFIKTNK